MNPKPIWQPLLVLLCAITLTWAQSIQAEGPALSRYSALLHSFACRDGVDYAALKAAHKADSLMLDFQWDEARYAAASKPEKLAYLINLYNAGTVKLIADHYPLASIRDLPKPWDQAVIPYFGAKISLNHLENEIIRKEFQEPRIHFALNCASKGCPPLRLSPYSGKHLEAELDSVATAFLRDPERNRLENDTLKLSQIFEWYGKDFDGKYGGFQNFVESRLGEKTQSKSKRKRVTIYLPYDWKLNDAPGCKGR